MKPTENIYDFPALVEKYRAGDNWDLGCVMLRVSFDDAMLSKGFSYGRISPADFYYSTDPERSYIAGDVTSKSHITLRYGLVKSAHEFEEEIHILLDDLGFDSLDYLPVSYFEAFPSTFNDEAYACIVARFDLSVLEEANRRLGYLPHINTFPDYKAHATVAYVKQSETKKWLEWLNSGVVSRVVRVQKDWLDLGREH